MAEFQIWFTFAVVTLAIVSYVAERVPMEITSLTTVVAILIFFHFFPVDDGAGGNRLAAETVLGGFASPALISIMALLVIGQGLFQTGALDTAVGPLLRFGARHPILSLGIGFVAVAVISAFMNNTPVVVMFIPVVTALAARLGMSHSRVLMPVSFVSILGGMTTLIGSSTNLIVSGVSVSAGGPPVGFFEPSPLGIVLAVCGGLYLIIAGRYLLRGVPSPDEDLTVAGGRQFIAQIEVTPGHVLDGATSRAGLFTELKDMTVRLVQRGEQALLPPFEDIVLAPGDVVIVAATRSALTSALASRNPILATKLPDDVSEADPGIAHDLVLAEAVVAPGSRLTGRTIAQAHLRAETQAIVLGIRRRSRMIRVALNAIRLEAGDVILVLGSTSAMRRLRFNRDVLLVEWSQTELPRARAAIRALAIMAVTVATAASGLLPISIAALGGALAMIPTGCLNIRQAARAFDRRIYLMVGASLALAAPLEATGAARLAALWVVEVMDGSSPAMLLSAFFLLIALFTNVLSNTATAALFTPIALSVAQELGLDAAPFVLTVIFAANCSFATPMAYQTNLLVMGPGHYRFADYLKTGGPLVIVIWLVYSVTAPWYFDL